MLWEPQQRVAHPRRLCKTFGFRSFRGNSLIAFSLLGSLFLPVRFERGTVGGADSYKSKCSGARKHFFAFFFLFSFFLITCEMLSTLEWLVGKPRGSKRGRGAVRGRDRWRARTDPRVPLLQVPRASERHDAAEAGSAVERPGVPAQLLRALPRALGGGAWSQAVSTGSSSGVRDGGDQHQRWPS